MPASKFAMARRPAVQPVFAPPADPDVPIWRYMDFTSFIAMLEYRGIFFPRADQVSDPYEGAISRASDEYRRRLRSELRREGLQLPPAQFRNLDDLYRRLRALTFVSAWHMNRHESAAMWAQYGPARGSVAIQSTYRKLRRALGAHAHIGAVRYINEHGESQPEISPLWRFMYKRKSFEHEHELRAVIADFTVMAKTRRARIPPEFGVWRRTSLDRLIDAVRVAPSSPRWLVELTRRVCRTYGLHKPVRQSSLDRDPFI